MEQGSVHSCLRLLQLEHLISTGPKVQPWISFVLHINIWIYIYIYIYIYIDTKILEVNLFAFAYRLFRRDFSPLDGTYCNMSRRDTCNMSRRVGRNLYETVPRSEV